MSSSKISKNYKKIFSDYWGYRGQDIPMCWGCNMQIAVDIHHLVPRGFGGSKKNSKNTIDNLMPLCRPCHVIAERDKFFNEELKIKLRNKIAEKEVEEDE